MIRNSAASPVKKLVILGRLKIFGLYVMLCALFGMRPRYLLTRDNKLRLRYLVYIWALVFAVPLTQFFIDNKNALIHHQYGAVQIAHAKAPTSQSNEVSKIDKAIVQKDGLRHLPQAEPVHKQSERDLAPPSYTHELAYNISRTADTWLNRNKETNKNKSFLIKAAYNPAQRSQDYNSDGRQYMNFATGGHEKSHDMVYYLPEENRVVKSLDPSLAPESSLNEPFKQADHKTRDKSPEKDQNAVNHEGKWLSAMGRPIPPRPDFDLTGVQFTSEVRVKTGDTFAAILHNSGVKGQEAQRIIQAVSKKYNPRYIKEGQKINLDFTLGRVRNDKKLTGLEMVLGPVQTLVVRRAGPEKYQTDIQKLELTPQLRAKSLVINNSLYASALNEGLPIAVFEKVLQIYAWDVDFQRDLRKGDKLQILYEAFSGRDGKIVQYGDIQFAALSVKGRNIPVYRFKTDKGRSDYFKRDGTSVRKTLMMTPIDGGRISSGYGMRHHPILGYSKMHKGVDFAAPIGTPVFAGGDGVIERIGRYGAYGNYIRIRHNNRLKTAYAHLKGYKKGLNKGDYVKQGDVIGYLGNTGRSTGPHLHYEVLVNDRQVKPGSLDLPTGVTLAGEDLKHFNEKIEAYHKMYALYLDDTKLASLSSN